MKRGGVVLFTMVPPVAPLPLDGIPFYIPQLKKSKSEMLINKQTLSGHTTIQNHKFAIILLLKRVFIYYIFNKGELR